ncbi:hypothetical protein [Corynebacterium hindlerae]|uniref:hypothetical protein n=1 Tax=Corynebacterium hindlerae TaxID=699041 RepID=UPI0031B6F487
MSFFSSIKKSLGLEKAQTTADQTPESSPAAPENPPLDPMFVMNDCVNPAIIEIFRDVAEGPEVDVIHGHITFDDHMRVSAVDNLVRNDIPVQTTPEAINRANKLLAPLSQMPADQKFTAISFNVSGGRLKTHMKYPD